MELTTFQFWCQDNNKVTFYLLSNPLNGTMSMFLDHHCNHLSRKHPFICALRDYVLQGDFTILSEIFVLY